MDNLLLDKFRQGATNEQLTRAAAPMRPCPLCTRNRVVVEPGTTPATFPTEGGDAPTCSSGYCPQAHALVQAPLQLIPLRRTQVAVLLSHLSPPVHFDLRCCASFLSRPHDTAANYRASVSLWEPWPLTDDLFLILYFTNIILVA